MFLKKTAKNKMLEWKDIESSERYQSFDDDKKNFVKANWFKKYITPSEEFQAYSLERKYKVIAGFFSDMLPEQKPEPGYGEVFAKSVARGVEEQILGGIGSLTTWAGDVIGIKELSKSGKIASKFWREAAQTGWEAPDPRIWSDTFWNNPSFKRAFGTIGQAAPSYAVAILASVMTGSPAWGAVSLAGLEAAPMREEALEKGSSQSKANLLAASAGIGIGLLEYIPLSRLLKRRGGFTVGAIKGGGEEAGQEALQTTLQNIIAKYGYDETRALSEGIIESVIAGSGTGGPVGGVTAKLNQLKADAKDKGVTDEEFKDLAGEIERELTPETILREAVSRGETTIEEIREKRKTIPDDHKMSSAMDKLIAESEEQAPITC
jgi:hypothetical protein